MGLVEHQPERDAERLPQEAERGAMSWALARIRPRIQPARRVGGAVRMALQAPCPWVFRHLCPRGTAVPVVAPG